MKKTFFILLLIIGFGFSNAQDVKFGLTAGYLNGGLVGKVEFEGLEVKETSSESGFYLGAVVDITFSDALGLQPELLYLNVSEGDFLQIPLNLKYYPANQFYVMGGPQFTITLNEVLEGERSVNIGLGTGLGFDITENFFVQGRYSFQLNNYLKDASIEFGSASIRLNTLTVGVGYKF